MIKNLTENEIDTIKTELKSKNLSGLEMSNRRHFLNGDARYYNADINDAMNLSADILGTLNSISVLDKSTPYNAIYTTRRILEDAIKLIKRIEEKEAKELND